MNKIEILWLYDDLLDLYGDWGNLLAVCRGLDAAGAGWNIDKKSLGEEVNFEKYQMIYIGPGKEKNLAVAGKDFARHREAAKSAVENGAVVLCIGNSRMLFGKSFVTAAGEEIPGAGLFDYTGKETGAVFVSDEWGHPVFSPTADSYGFINRTGVLSGEMGEPLFTLESGAGDGDEAEAKCEGTLYKNFFGTWQLGPVLVKNPLVLKEVLSRLLGEDYRDFDTFAEELALKQTINDIKG